MESTEVRHLKGAVHLALAVAPILELKHSSSKFRTAILGLAAGWHLSCAHYHFFVEGDKHDNILPRKTKNTDTKRTK
jgi:hypothetical protein